MTNASFIATLTDISILQISGEQSHEYLHGQLTVNTKTFDPNKARLTAHCDFKGKMFSSSWISYFQDSFLLAMHSESAETSLAQLKKYGVFSKVDISVNSSLACIGIAGEEPCQYLKVLFPDLRKQHLSLVSNQFGQVICFNDTSLRYLCYLSDKGLQRLLDISDTEGFTRSEPWNVLEILAGIANIQDATSGQFVPQMLNLQSLEAIDFDKGCYMGQEVVARTKFLGKNKRATFLLKGEIAQSDLPNSPETAIKAGDNIEVQLDGNWRRGGLLARVAIVKSDENGNNKHLYALAVMPNDTEIGSSVRLKDTEITLSVETMPYSVTN